MIALEKEVLEKCWKISDSKSLSKFSLLWEIQNKIRQLQPINGSSEKF